VTRSATAALTLFACAAAFAARAPVARAGGCTPCTTSQECVDAFGAPAFCIEWTDGTVACPGMPTPERGCCPGQGCATFSGRPSCEAEGRCRVVDDDAGTPGGPDAGAPGGTDSGSTGGTDSGSTGGTDAGTTGSMDAGGTPAPSSGCGCRVGSRSSSEPAVLGIAGLVLFALARRRR
jgi:MYXO-CTERM domain-containing protein